MRIALTWAMLLERERSLSLRWQGWVDHMSISQSKSKLSGRSMDVQYGEILPDFTRIAIL